MNSAQRKATPLFSGLMMYFPDALLAIAQHSKKGNDKHNPGQPLHWAKDKSADQADCIARHLVDIGPNWDALDDETGSLHAVALAWRALALLQTVLERKNKQQFITEPGQCDCDMHAEERKPALLSEDTSKAPFNNELEFVETPEGPTYGRIKKK